MRYAVLSDIHGNLHALRAVLDAVREDGIDEYICAGDLVGYGPFPNECVQLVADRSMIAVAGNHELMVLGRLGTRYCTGTARATVEWTRSALTDRTRRFLAGLPERLVLAEHGICLTHGALDQPWRYVTTATQATEQLDRLAVEVPGGTLLVLGHTHRPWLYAYGHGTVVARSPGAARLAGSPRYLLNPGSVGQSRDDLDRARFAVLDTTRRWVHFRSIRYDVRGCRRALRSAGLPVDACHHRSPVPVRAGRAVMRAARAAVGVEGGEHRGQEP